MQDFNDETFNVCLSLAYIHTKYKIKFQYLNEPKNNYYITIYLYMIAKRNE